MLSVWNPTEGRIGKWFVEVGATLLKVSTVTPPLANSFKIDGVGNIGFLLVHGLLKDSSRLISDHRSTSVRLIGGDHGDVALKHH